MNRRWNLIARRFASNKLAVFGLVTLVFLFLLAFAGPYFSPFDYRSMDPYEMNYSPTWRHWFGTDIVGHDMFVQTLHGLRRSLLIGVTVALISTTIAALVGSIAGFMGGKIDAALMWIVDLLLVIPSFLLLAVCSPLFKGKSAVLLVVLLALFSWMISARMVRSITRSLREREFVKASEFMGSSPWRTIVTHIIPSMASILIADTTLSVGSAIVTEAGLSFFGFGVQPPDVSLGTLIRDGSGSVTTYWWLFIYSASILVIIMLAVNFIGDGLRDALDPHAYMNDTKAQR